MICRLDELYRKTVNQLIKENWAGPIVVTKSVAHDTTASDGFISIENESKKLTGYVLFAINGSECEILVLESLKQNYGIGTDLINAVKTVARENYCNRIWLITTNDNIHAIRYYQKHGFELGAVYINAIEKSREIKPSIPLIGNDEIPIKHEYEFFCAV